VTIPADEAIRASGARVLEGDAVPSDLRFSTDTRTLERGDVFVALRGERFDGHAYVERALAAGAAAVVVDDAASVPQGVPAFVVGDTTVAYLAFASVARAHTPARVAAVTGSAGKTTTKAFLAHVLGAAAPTVATPRNENNEIGVAKLFLSLPRDAAFVVVEFGARHVGEIATLARAVRPDVAVVTNIGEAHLEIFGSRERLAETKWGIFDAGARRVANAGDRDSRALAARDGVPARWFGVDGDPDAPHGERFVRLRGRASLEISGGGAALRSFPTDIAVPGDHNLRNVAAAAAVALELGLAPDAIAAALASLALPDGRYERSSPGDFDVIYDAYNANPSGMIATLASFARERASRRVAVLASMAELGDDAAEMHRTVGAAAARAGLAALLVGGDFAAELASGALAAGMPSASIVPFASNEAATAWLRANGRAGDLVLLKGSRRYKLEDVLAGLRGAHA
jgi:UDP-N-acetylmuramoyl-tripeptide--D-alanyl-D-alanine ligase